MPSPDPFQQLGLAPRFALDGFEIDRRQRELFIERKAEGLVGLEAVNQAVRVLKDPVRRAEQLFRLRGWPLQATADESLLERAFAEREAIDAARKKSDVEALQNWLDDVAEARQEVLIAGLTQLLDAGEEPTRGALSDQAQDTDGIQGRALRLLEELRYLSRAITAARSAIEAIED